MDKNNCTKKQLELQDLLEKALSKWFGLHVADVPKVITTMGIREGCLIEIDEVSNSSAKLTIFSGNKEYTLIISRGDMVKPYPTWCLICDECRTYFAVDANLYVELLCLFDQEGKISF